MRIKFFLAIATFFLLDGVDVFAQGQNPDTAKVVQKDLIDIFLKYIHFSKKKEHKERKVYFSFLPLSGASTNGNALRGLSS